MFEEENKVETPIAENNSAKEENTPNSDVSKEATPNVNPTKPYNNGGNRFNKGEHRDNRHPRNKDDSKDKEFEERVVDINRISKTVQGGRRMRFSALVVVGDGKGRYGFALAKSGEVPDAIKKSLESAKHNIYRIHIVKGDTIAHEVIGRFGATKVFLKPAPAGTGIIAGGPVRAILELSGIKNVVSKVYGARASINIIRATHDAISQLKSYSQVKALRGLNNNKQGGTDL